MQRSLEPYLALNKHSIRSIDLYLHSLLGWLACLLSFFLFFLDGRFFTA